MSLKVEEPFKSPQGLTPCVLHKAIQVPQCIVPVQSLTIAWTSPRRIYTDQRVLLVEHVTVHATRMVDDLFRISWELCIIVMLGVIDLGKPYNQSIHRLGKNGV